jgi:hypothetical protein
MSIFRLSVLKSQAFAPDPRGNLLLDGYSRRRRIGGLGEFAAPMLAPRSSDFRHYFERALATAAAELGADQPVVVMVHGFLFDPKQTASPHPPASDNPHSRLYHFTPRAEHEEQRDHDASWPVGLGFSGEDEGGADGLAIAFGWHSQPGFAQSLIEQSENFYARAYDYAGLSAWVLVNTLHMLNILLPDRQVDIFCHSLGSRVVVRAIALAAKNYMAVMLERLGRVIILGGSEYVVEAQLMQRRLESLPLQSRPDFYNIITRENDVLDKLGENFGPRTFGNTQVIGHNGLGTRNPPDTWIDLQIDRHALQTWMSNERGIEISGDRPSNVWDHWYYYTFRSNMDFYRGILRERDQWSIGQLREQGIPEGVPRTWWDFGD